MPSTITGTETTRFIADILDQLRDGLDSFGEYTLFDKGASEIVNVHSIGVRIEKLPAPEAAVILRSVSNSWSNLPGPRSGAPARLAGELVLGLQEWDALFDEPGVADMLNNDKPSHVDGDAPVAASPEAVAACEATLRRAQQRRRARP